MRRKEKEGMLFYRQSVTARILICLQKRKLQVKL